MILHEQITLLSLHLGTSAPDPHVRRDIINVFRIVCTLSDRGTYVGYRAVQILACATK